MRRSQNLPVFSYPLKLVVRVRSIIYAANKKIVLKPQSLSLCHWYVLLYMRVLFPLPYLWLMVLFYRDLLGVFGEKNKVVTFIVGNYKYYNSLRCLRKQPVLPSTIGKVAGTPAILNEAFLCFLHSLQENILTNSKLGYNQFLTHRLKLIISKSFL